MVAQSVVAQATGTGRTVALFPGAFRPPHAAHFAAVLDLAQRPEVDEVVVIIANRNRTLPGSTLTIDAVLVQQIWTIFLDATDMYPMLAKVHTEIAEHSAIQQALGYLEQGQSGDTLYFCIGEGDLAQGDPRFAMLFADGDNTGAAQRGVRIRVIPVPTGKFTVRATDLRNYLKMGAAGQDLFMAAMPTHLSVAQRQALWACCNDGLRDIPKVMQAKVQTILHAAAIPAAAPPAIVRSGKVDPVFRLRQPDGRHYYVKYAGDTVVEGAVGDPFEPKPRRRLGTERRALNYLHKTLPPNTVALPEIIYFDKTTRTIVLSEVCPGGRSLQHALAHGRFDATVAARLGSLLARLHQPSPALRPFWGEDETDLAHWRTMLAWRTTQIDCPSMPPDRAAQLAELYRHSDEARRPGFFHLDCVPKNIRLGSHEPQVRKNGAPVQLGFIDFELCASIGDPAYDLGILLGHYLFWGITTNRGQHCSCAWQTMVATYQTQTAECTATLLARARSFAGAALLGLTEIGPQTTAACREQMIGIATKLLGVAQWNRDTVR